MILDLMNVCSDPALSYVLAIIKRIIVIIQIIAPIILIVFSCVKLFNKVVNPEEKNSVKAIINSFIALAIIFLVPTLLNVVMYIIGEKTNFSNCWNSSSNSFLVNSKYISRDNSSDKKRTKVYNDTSDYHGKINSSQSIGNNYNNNYNYSYDYSSLESTTIGEKIARLAVRVSPSADPDQRIYCHPWLHWGVDRATVGQKMSDYVKIMDATTTKYLGDKSNPNSAYTDGNYNNPAYCSCTQGTGAIIRAVADPDLDMSGDVNIYLKRHPEKWVPVGVVRVGEKFDDKCQPGDLLVHRIPDNINAKPTSSHVMLYVGHKIAQEKFPKTNGNIFQTGYNSSDVENSWGPQINYIGKDWREFVIYRFTGKGDSYYPLIDVEKVLSEPMKVGKFW